MKGTFETALPRLFAHEGGYSDDPKDPGNWSGGDAGLGRLVGTNHGIAAPTLAAWRKCPVTAADMKALTKHEALEIYRAQYWTSVRGDELPAGLDYCVLDASVNSGPAQAVKWLQRAAGVRADGIVGAITLDAVNRADANRLIDSMCDQRLTMLRTLKTWSRYRNGWSSRVADVRRASKEMAAGRVEQATPLGLMHPTPKADPRDIDVARSPEAIGGGVAGVGAAGAAVLELVPQLHALGESQIIRTIVVVMVLIGVGLTVWSALRSRREQAA